MIFFLTLSIIFGILASVVLFIVAPLKTFNWYKAKGYPTYFFPILDEIYADAKRLETTGDIFSRAKEFTKDFPNQKVLITNVGNKPLVSLNNPFYIKEFLLKPNLMRRLVLNSLNHWLEKVW